MAMYFYASKISAIACAARCKKTVLQKSRGQRDRDKDKHRLQGKCPASSANSATLAEDVCRNLQNELAPQTDVGIFSLVASTANAESMMPSCCLETVTGQAKLVAGSEHRCSPAQLSAHNLELGLKHFESATAKANANAMPIAEDNVQCDLTKNQQNRIQCDNNIEKFVVDSADIMYTHNRIISGNLEALIELLLPKEVIDLNKDFLFSFLLSARLFLHPHELFAKLISFVAESDCLESLVAVLTEWTHKFPYDYRDERMMNHVKHIVARCSNSHLEAVVSQVLSALLQRLTDLEKHEADLRACHINNDKPVAQLDCSTALQYAQILCRLEKKLAKQIGPEEFLQCSSLVIVNKQKLSDQTSISDGTRGVQYAKKTCNLEAYLDWSARLRLFVCNEILQCSEAEQRVKTVELWSGVSQYCLLVGNYNSATTILESFECPAIARLQITWSKLQVTWQQLDCMQRHAEGHGHLWQKQAIVLNEQRQQQPKSPRTDKLAELTSAKESTTTKSSLNTQLNSRNELSLNTTRQLMFIADEKTHTSVGQDTKTTHKVTSSEDSKNWVVIPVFSDIVKLAIAERDNCLRHLPNGHIDIAAFQRMGAIVGAFTKHMQSVKSTVAPSSDEFQNFSYHMQQTIKLGEADLMMASFKCEQPSSAEELIYK